MNKELRERVSKGLIGHSKEEVLYSDTKTGQRLTMITTIKGLMGELMVTVCFQVWNSRENRCLLSTNDLDEAIDKLCE